MNIVKDEETWNREQDNGKEEGLDRWADYLMKGWRERSGCDREGTTVTYGQIPWVSISRSRGNQSSPEFYEHNRRWRDRDREHNDGKKDDAYFGNFIYPNCMMIQIWFLVESSRFVQTGNNDDALPRSMWHKPARSSFARYWVEFVLVFETWHRWGALSPRWWTNCTWHVLIRLLVITANCVTKVSS